MNFYASFLPKKCEMPLLKPFLWACGVILFRTGLFRLVEMSEYVDVGLREFHVASGHDSACGVKEFVERHFVKS